MNSQHLKKQNINSKETNQELLLRMNVLNKHLQISKEDIKKQVDKCYRIGPKNEDGTQATILKFKSDSFKECKEENQEQKNQNQDFPCRKKA